MISLVLMPAATMALLMGLLVVTTATLITVAVVIMCRHDIAQEYRAAAR